MRAFSVAAGSIGPRRYLGVAKLLQPFGWAWHLRDMTARAVTIIETEEARHASIEALFHDQYQPMVRLAHALCGSNAVAEDLVQECFSNLFRRWPDIETPDAYLRTAVVNACKMFHRRRSREKRRLELVGAGDATVSLEARELLDALDGLTPPQRIALVLRYYDGRSEAEIADALDCPVGTVKSHLHRGLARLREVAER
jgi:RNA polymerase sigma-70 factor (sigma-E family)